MRRFIIEREVAGAGDLSLEELAKIARTSNEAVASLGVPYTCEPVQAVPRRGVCASHVTSASHSARRCFALPVGASPG